ncbi:MAG: hypothetical protein U0871_04740 [Gemmataceae bacterium]
MLPVANPATPATVHEFDAIELEPGPGNSLPTIEEVTRSGLYDNLASEPQQQPVIAGDVNPATGRRPLYAGVRRWFVLRLLGKKIKGLVLSGPVTRADLVKYRLTENVLRRTMSPFEIGADVVVFMAETNCSQEEAAAKFGMSPAKLSKLLRMYRKAVDAVREAVESHVICPSVGEIIATLPPEKQPELLERAVKGQIKRDTVERLAKSIRGERVRKPKQWKWNGGLGTVIVPGNASPQQIREWLAEKLKQVDHAVKHNLPLDSLK